MSNNVFAKNKLSEIFKDLDSESLNILPNSINIIDLNASEKSSIMSQSGGSATSEFNSSFMPENESYLSATSSNTSMFMPQKGGSFNTTNGEMTSSFMPQNGGYLSATSVNKNNNNEVNQLISMLTSDSNDNNNFTANSTATEELENRLRKILFL